MLNLFSRQREVADQPQASPRNQKRRIALPSKIKSAGAVYNATGMTETRTSFRESEYNLGEIAKVMDIEAFVRQAFNKHVELCLKEGYRLSSRNEEATRYIKRRFREMAEVSGVTLNMLLRSVTQNIVAYSNAFIVKVRDASISSGSPIVRTKRAPSAPIAAYFNLDPTTIRIKRDVHGKVYRYEQKVPGNPIIPEFHADNIVHFYYDRKEGLAFGTPYIIPVLDDIRTLRRMEENIEILLVQHLFPLYQYIVGTEENPAEVYEDGTTEVDVIKAQIENMPTEGSIVTPERHDIKALGAEGKALDASNYLRYFEQRVLAGLGMSELALGRGGTANRSTSVTIDKMMTDRCKDFQDVIEEFVNEYIIKELLYEGGFEIDENEDNFVKLKFNEIDIDSMLKTENHIVYKYEHDATTETEMREGLGLDPVTDEQRQDMYFERVTKPKSIIMAVDEPYCFSKDAEILTDEGWKLLSDVTINDKVAVLNGGEKLLFENPKKIYALRHTGKMYLLRTRFLDVCVTPNHKLYVCRRNRNNTNKIHDFMLDHAENMFGEYKKFKRSAVWEGRDIKYITLNELKRDIVYSNKKHFPAREIKAEYWMKFLGWYLSEGCSSYPNGKISISQSKLLHNDNYLDIVDTLLNIGVEFQESDSEIGFSDFQIKEYIHRECGVYQLDRRIPKDIKALSNRLLKILMETMMAGDGETAYHYVYSTISKQLADDVQEIALKCGYAANIRIDSSPERARDIYRVAIYRDKYVDVADREPGGKLAQSSIEEYIDYDDMVYCVETSTGVVYVRQNGKARWCGNTAEAKGGVVSKISKEEKKKKETENREKPTNQHGTKPARTSQKKDQLLHESLEDIAKALGAQQETPQEEDKKPAIKPRDITVDRIETRLRGQLLNNWDATMRDAIDLVGDNKESNEEALSSRVDFIVNLTKDSIAKHLYVNMAEALSHGEAAAAAQLNGSFKQRADQNMKREVIKQEVQKCSDDLLGGLSQIIVRHVSTVSDAKMLIPTVVGVFSALKYKIDSLAKRQVNKAYNFGYNLVMEDNADVVPDNVRSE